MASAKRVPVQSGGKTGTSTRVAEQMKRLFGAQITAVDTGRPGQRGFKLRNMSVVNEMDLDEEEFERRLTSPPAEAQGEGEEKSDEQALWTPQREQSGWKSRVLLTEYFFEEIRKSPVPIDLRAYKKLRGSPLSMDIYAWLTG